MAATRTQVTFERLVTKIATGVQGKIGGGSLPLIEEAVSEEISAHVVAESYDSKTEQLTITLTVPQSE